MTAVIRFGFFASLCALALGSVGSMSCSGGSGGSGGGGGGSGGGGGGGCFEDIDCPDKNLFFCNTTTNECDPACHTKTDCDMGTRGQYALSFCDNNPLHCQCDNGTCVGALCGSDSDCGGTQVCRSGACVAAPAATDVAKCVVLPDYAVLKAGSTLKFHVEAFKADGTPVVLNTGITWSATAGTVTGANDSADYTAAGAAAAEADGPKATIGSTSCTAKVVVVDGSPATTEIAAIVSDELSGRGVSGATVMVTDGTTGAVIGTNGTTDSTGYAKVTGLAGTETDVNVSAFSSGYNYLTVANYNPTTGSRVISMVVRRNQTDNYGGSKGKFSPTPMTSNVHVGLSGMSIAGGITDLSLAQLLGNTVPTHVKIGSAIDQPDVPLPAGVYLGFSDQLIKTDISAQGLAGTCSGYSDSATRIAAGTCGTRTNWGLAGDIPLGDLPISAFAGGTGNLNFGTILAAVIPIFKKFSSAIVRDVEFKLDPTPITNGAPDFTDAGTADFTNQDLPFNSAASTPPGNAVPLAFDFVTTVPSLPKFKNTYVDGVLLLGGANVPGRGVVPLGLGVAVNTMPADDKTDKEADLSAQGLVTLRMAPTHDGIEGTQYGILALALSFKSFTDSTAGVATSGLFTHPANNKLTFDPSGTSPVPLAGTFPVFPEGAKYNFSDVDAPGLTKRTFKIPTTSGSDLDSDLKTKTSVVRVTFTDVAQHRWVVLADPARVSVDGFHLPKPPTGAVDRTFTNDMATGDRSDLLVQTVRLADGSTNIPFKDLVEANNSNADRITDFTTGFSFIDYGKPTIAWKTPTAGGTIAHGGTATVTVTHFTVDMPSVATADGYVKVALTGGTGCDQPILGQSDMSMGKGQIDMTIPAGCTGSVQATAALVDPTGADLNPAVKAGPISITVN